MAGGAALALLALPQIVALPPTLTFHPPTLVGTGDCRHPPPGASTGCGACGCYPPGCSGASCEPEYSSLFSDSMAYFHAIDDTHMFGEAQIQRAQAPPLPPRMPLAYTSDGGRHWQTLPAVPAAGVGFGMPMMSPRPGEVRSFGVAVAVNRSGDADEQPAMLFVAPNTTVFSAEGGQLRSRVDPSPVVFDFAGTNGTAPTCHHANNGPAPGLRLEGSGVISLGGDTLLATPIVCEPGGTVTSIAAFLSTDG